MSGPFWGGFLLEPRHTILLCCHKEEKVTSKIGDRRIGHFIHIYDFFGPSAVIVLGLEKCTSFIIGTKRFFRLKVRASLALQIFTLSLSIIGAGIV